MNLSPIRAVSLPIADAFKAALEAAEPVLVPQAHYADDRGWSLMNQMQGVLAPQGQINFSVTYPGVIKAWHRHAKQTDFWIALTGNLKVGVHREADARSWMAVIGEKRPAVVIIPPPLWHGAATVGDTPAGLLYYVTHAYDPAKPDEDRRPFDSIPGFPWGVRHG
ncbi:MAG: dTDP-4-dehydrorhamnose 3,5-epimerase family protein [Phycisphaerae bacterium]|nr:dTDP-4-dehydrorhamnose 3,5-epimerase family protein [Phycisphaerae bacterium]